MPAENLLINIDAEKAVLGSILLDNSCISDVIHVLKPEWFYSPANQKLYNCCIDLFRESITIDSVTLFDLANKKDILISCGGAEYIAELLQFVPTVSNAVYYSEVVKECAKRRRLKEFYQSKANDSGKVRELNEVISDTNKEFVLIEDEFGYRDKVLDYEKGFEIFDKEYETKKNLEGGIDGIRSGWPSIDAITLGWHPGEFILIVGMLGIGKTFLLLKNAHEAVKQKKKVMICSLEMPDFQVFRRFISLGSGSPFGRVRSAKLSYDELAKLAEYRKKSLEEYKDYLVILDRKTINCVADIDLAVRIHKPDFVLIDGIYLLEEGGGATWENVKRASNRTKQLGVKRSIPVFATAQFNREGGEDSKTGGSKKYGYSYALPQDADISMEVYREGEQALIKLGKVRDSVSNASVIIHWRMESTNFDEIGLYSEEDESVTKNIDKQSEITY